MVMETINKESKMKKMKNHIAAIMCLCFVFCFVDRMQGQTSDTLTMVINKVYFFNPDTSANASDSTVMYIDFSVNDIKNCNTVTIKVGNNSQMNDVVFLNRTLTVQSYQNKFNYLVDAYNNHTIRSSNGKSTSKKKINTTSVTNAKWASISGKDKS